MIDVYVLDSQLEKSSTHTIYTPCHGIDREATGDADPAVASVRWYIDN